MHDASHTPNNKPAVIGIALALLCYIALLLVFKPAGLSLHHAEHDSTAESSEHGDGHADDAHHDDAPDDEHGEHGGHGDSHAGDSGHGSGQAAVPIPHYWAVIPFVLLLGGIALLPLIGATAHWWESNANRLLLAAILALCTLAYYLMVHPAAGLPKVVDILKHAVLGEYVPFIVLLFSLYAITGGIRIQGDLVARPLTNVGFLVVGGLLASFVGTTGAAMLLIRSLIETNNERKNITHTVVFFIFVVCNCGGCLLPIGDPPLFLGYLLGVDFLWTMKYLWGAWLLTNTLIILVYFVIDTFYFYPKESRADLALDEATRKPLKIRGLMPNLLLLAGVIFSVACLDPLKTLPGTDWHPWPFLREAVQLLLVLLSLVLGSREIRIDNKFNYHAILEVAALFIGIFICMQPALEILHQRGGELGLKTPTALYWATGALSAVLDNAPTYVVFYETAAAEPAFAGNEFATLVSAKGALADQARQLLVGISLGAVFMGALTYIGNGPNFMVRAIAEQSGVRMPSFFGYIFKYSLPILLPIYFVVALIML